MASPLRELQRIKCQSLSLGKITNPNDVVYVLSNPDTWKDYNMTQLILCLSQLSQKQLKIWNYRKVMK